MPQRGAIVIATTGSLSIGSGVTLTVRGDFVLGQTNLTLQDDSVLEFDASAAPDPSNTNYVLQMGEAY